MFCLKNLLIYGLILYLCNTLNNPTNEEAKNRRKERMNRKHRIRVDDDNKIGEKIWEDSLGKDNIDPPEPFDQFHDIKENGILCEHGVNGENYESYLDDSDIYEILSDASKLFGEKSESFSNGQDTKDNSRRLVIIGADERVEITGNPITSWPQQFSGLLTFQNSAGITYQCSGTMIDHDWVLTAGHCLHSGPGGGWYTNFIFYPRRNRYDSSTGYGWLNAYSFTGWTINGDWNWDFGLLKLSSYANVGYAGLAWTSGTFLNNYINYCLGYPADKPFGTMWTTNDNPNPSLTTDYIVYYNYRSDIYGGESGGQWYINYFGNYYTIAVQSHHNTYYNYNGATRINKYKYDWICTYVNRC